MRLGIAQYHLRPQQWPASLKLTIAAVADVHACRPWMDPARIRSIVQRTNDLGADMIVLLGDYVAGHRMVTDYVHSTEWSEALAGLKAHLDASVDAVRDSLLAERMKLDVSANVAEGFRRDVERRIARLERRIVAASKRSQQAADRDIATLRAALFPYGKPQERFLNLIPLLVRHGPTLLSDMLERARVHASELVPVTGAESGSRRLSGEVSARPS